MNIQRIGGIAFLATGVILFTIGLNASNSVADRWSNFFTGHFTDATMWFIVAGIVAAIAGLALVLSGRRMVTT